MSEYHTFCLLFFITLLVVMINNKTIRLQTTIAITAGTLLVSAFLKLINATQWATISSHIIELIQHINFEHFLLHGILGLLLFAGAINIDIKRLSRQKWEVMILALLGTSISTVFIGGILFSLCQVINFPLSLIHCLLFGALISPTDPIAVLAIVKKLGAPESITSQIEGESLFNDGIGLVIFSSLYTLAFSSEPISIATVGNVFLTEAVGGIIVGAIFGICCHTAIKLCSNLNLKVILTVFLATGGYAFADIIGVSAPLAIVVAGIFVGNFTIQTAFSTKQGKILEKIWEVIDECFNGILFALVGFSVLVINVLQQDMIVVILAIPVSLVARYLSVSFAYQFFSKFRQYNPLSVSVIAWGGLRGGLAIAMALSIPADIWLDSNQVLNLKEIILAMTYAVVIFSILVQGTTIPSLINKANRYQ